MMLIYRWAALYWGSTAHCHQTDASCLRLPNWRNPDAHRSRQHSPGQTQKPLKPKPTPKIFNDKSNAIDGEFSLNQVVRWNLKITRVGVVNGGSFFILFSHLVNMHMERYIYILIMTKLFCCTPRAIFGLFMKGTLYFTMKPVLNLNKWLFALTLVEMNWNLKIMIRNHFQYHLIWPN